MRCGDDRPRGIVESVTGTNNRFRADIHNMLSRLEETNESLQSVLAGAGEQLVAVEGSLSEQAAGLREACEAGLAVALGLAVVGLRRRVANPECLFQDRELRQVLGAARAAFLASRRGRRSTGHAIHPWVEKSEK